MLEPRSRFRQLDRAVARQQSRNKGTRPKYAARRAPARSALTLDAANVEIVTANIARGLAPVAPDRAAVFEANRRELLARVTEGPRGEEPVTATNAPAG